MGVKGLIFLIIAMVFISACSIEEKTKPVITDITEEVAEEVQKQEAVSEEEKVEEGAIAEEVEEEPEIIEAEEEEQEEELPPGTHVVTIKDLRLDPQELTIKQGDTIVWKHEDTWEEDVETRHLLVAHYNEFRNKQYMYYGDTFNHTFNKTGTFTYFDVLYPERDYMRGKIVVE